MRDGVAVFLTVEVGPGQPSGIAVRLAGELLLSAPQIRDHALGVGDSLRGRRLLTDVIVRNDNPQTDRVGARLSLRGGVDEQDWTERAELEASVLGRFSFTITFV